MFALAILVVLLVGSGFLAYHQISTSRAEKRERDEEIVRGKHEAALRLREREKNLKRQEAAGDRIFWALARAWEAAGSPTQLTPRRIPRNGGTYYFEVGRPTPDPMGTLFWVHINFSREGEEVHLTGSIPGERDREMDFSASNGEGFITIILAQRLYGSRVP